MGVGVNGMGQGLGLGMGVGLGRGRVVSTLMCVQGSGPGGCLHSAGSVQGGQWSHSHPGSLASRYTPGGNTCTACTRLLKCWMGFVAQRAAS